MKLGTRTNATLLNYSTATVSGVTLQPACRCEACTRVPHLAVDEAAEDVVVPVNHAALHEVRRCGHLAKILLVLTQLSLRFQSLQSALIVEIPHKIIKIEQAGGCNRLVQGVDDLG